MKSFQLLQQLIIAIKEEFEDVPRDLLEELWNIEQWIKEYGQRKSKS